MQCTKTRSGLLRAFRIFPHLHCLYFIFTKWLKGSEWQYVAGQVEIPLQEGPGDGLCVPALMNPSQSTRTLIAFAVDGLRHLKKLSIWKVVSNLFDQQWDLPHEQGAWCWREGRDPTSDVSNPQPSLLCPINEPKVIREMLHSSSKSKNALVGCCIFNMYQSFLPLKSSNQAFVCFHKRLHCFTFMSCPRWSLHQARASDLDSETAKRAWCSGPMGIDTW